MPEDDIVQPASLDTGSDASTLVDTQTTAPESPAPSQTTDTGTASSPADLETDQRSDEVDTPPVSAPAEPQVDWADRYKNLQSYADRRNQGYTKHVSEMQTRLQEMEQKSKQWEQSQQAKPWQRAHPDHGKFGHTLTAAKTIHKQLQALDQSVAQPGMDPQQHAQQVMFAKQQIMAGMSPQDQQALGEYRENMQEWQNKLFTDPEEAIGPIAAQVAQQVYAQIAAKQAGQQAVDRDFNAPHLQPILQDPKYAGYLQDRLNRGVPYDDAMEMLKLRAIADLASAKFKDSNRLATHAQEQVRLAQRRASTTTTSDPQTSAPDPYKLAMRAAKEQGYAPGSSEFNRLYDQFASRVS